MQQQIIYVTLVVRAYDEAIAFYTQALGFDLVEDTDLGAGKRWVLVRPPGGGTCLLLAQAASPVQAAIRPAGASAFFSIPTTSGATMPTSRRAA
jgi:catechol 2,3-dioxygenase-like lactoylglutathione lyase family enzyme